MTLPLLPRTLPKRTATNFVLERSAMVCTIISQTRLLAPMTFVGFAALSVEMSTKVSVP